MTVYFSATVWENHHNTHTHTHTHPFNGPLSGTSWVSRYQKGNINLDFTEARDSEWQWHQLGHMQVCTSITMPAPNHSVLYRPDALPATQPTVSQHWRHNWSNSMQRKQSYNANVMLQLLVTQIRLRRLILNGGQLRHKPAKCPPQRSLKQMTDCANVSSPTSQKKLGGSDILLKQSLCLTSEATTANTTKANIH